MKPNKNNLLPLIRYNAKIKREFTNRLFKIHVDLLLYMRKDVIKFLYDNDFLVIEKPKKRLVQDRLFNISFNTLLNRKNVLVKKFADKVENDRFNKMFIDWWKSQLLGYVLKSNNVITRQIKGLIHWFTVNVGSTTSTAQRQQLEQMGISKRVIDMQFTIPTVNNTTRITREAYDTLRKYGLDIENDITQSLVNQAKNIKNDINDLFLNETVAENKEQIIKKVDKSKIDRFSESVNNHASNLCQKDNLKSIGITEGSWIHVAGKFTSRETHKKMNGKVFNLSIGLYDPDVKKNVLCGELPYCRCCYRAIIPSYMLHDD